MVKQNCMAEKVMLPLQRSLQVVLLYFITLSPHSKFKRSNVSHRDRCVHTLGIHRHKWHIKFASSILQDFNRLKIRTDWICTFKPPRSGKNRSILQPNNFSLYPNAKSFLIFFKKHRIMHFPLSHTRQKENLTYNS